MKHTIPRTIGSSGVKLLDRVVEADADWSEAHLPLQSSHQPVIQTPGPLRTHHGGDGTKHTAVLQRLGRTHFHRSSGLSLDLYKTKWAWKDFTDTGKSPVTWCPCRSNPESVRVLRFKHQLQDQLAWLVHGGKMEDRNREGGRGEQGNNIRTCRSISRFKSFWYENCPSCLEESLTKNKLNISIWKAILLTCTGEHTRFSKTYLEPDFSRIQWEGEEISDAGGSSSTDKLDCSGRGNINRLKTNHCCMKCCRKVSIETDVLSNDVKTREMNSSVIWRKHEHNINTTFKQLHNT